MKRVVLLFAIAAASCTADRASTRSTSNDARAELDALRTRFPSAPLVATTERSPHPARVTLPARADGDVVLEDTTSDVAIRFRYEGAPSVARVDVDGVAIYADAGIVHRVQDAGIEDYVAFDARPEREEAGYAIDVTRVAGLRLVGDSLEMLDAHGAPRLRVNAPYVIDARGARQAATLAIEGCAYDTNPAGPWDRAVTAPGADHCTVRVAWSGVRYPALLDPGWTTTGSGSPGRDGHTAVKLGTGKVLVTYGNACSGGCLLAPGAALFDPATGTFAGTGGPNDRGVDAPGVTLANGNALILGGSTQVYDKTAGTFTSTALPACSSCTLVTLSTGKTLVAGSTAFLFDPATSAFTAAGAMHASRPGLAMSVLASGKVLVTGGTGLASAEIYDPTTDTFTLTGSMSASRSGHVALTLGSGSVLVVDASGASAELYDPVAGTFAPTGALQQARTNFTANVLGSGRAIIAGGYIGLTPTTSTERYEPSTGTFVTAPSMNVARGEHRTTLLDDGRLLATFGRNMNNNFGNSLQSAELLSFIASGAACVADADCGSGICDHGICCASACTSSCHACSAGTGTCDAVKSADDPDTCFGTKTCDASGACKSKLGQTCAGGAECVDAFCTDSVCCDRACSGTCEACDGLVRGTCSAIAGPPHGTRACASNDPSCGGACDGTNVASCIYPSATTGCGTTCSVDTRTARACDGKGACVDQPARPCPGNFVCADGASCKTHCMGNADCAIGYGCAAGACVAAGHCDGDHTVTSTDGTSTTDCTPLKCDQKTNGCKTTCVDVTDCANPFICDATGTCSAAPSSGDTSGCGVGGHGGGTGSFAALAMLLVARGVRRRRRQNS